MSWAGIGGAVIGGYVAGKAQKSSNKAEKEMQEKSLAEQKEIAEMQLAKQLSELRGRQLGQEEALGRATGIRRAEESEFERETTGTPLAIEKLKKLIRQRALPEQQQALAQTKLGLIQAGVRGPEAGLISKQQATKMGLDLSRAVEEIGLKQALADRDKRATMAGTKALAGLAQELKPIEKVGSKSLSDIKDEIEDYKKKKLEEEKKKTPLFLKSTVI